MIERFTLSKSREELIFFLNISPVGEFTIADGVFTLFIRYSLE